MFKFLIITVGMLLGIAFLLGISSIIFWGLGNLIIWVFKINYTWTIWHGFVISLVFTILREMFGGKK